MSFGSIPRDRLRCFMNVPAVPVVRVTTGGAGGTGGSGLASVGTTGRAFSSLTPRHYMTTKLPWKEKR